MEITTAKLLARNRGEMELVHGEVHLRRMTTRRLASSDDDHKKCNSR